LEEFVAALAPQQIRPAGLPAADDIGARASAENFPVASRLLPGPARADLLALYGFARLTDHLGDEWTGDRLAALDWLEAELDRALAGQPAHPLVRAAARTVIDRHLDAAPLRHLIQANRQDQLVHRYDSFPDLLAYCELSANPVGRLVLGVLGVDTPERQRWSDLVCTGLQLAEHWQDVAEDAAAGRVYLPSDDLERFGVDVAELRAPSSSPALRGLMAFEVARARTFLDTGSALIASLHGRVRWAVAGFVAGGEAALDAIAGADFDVISATRRPSPLGVSRRLVGAVVRSGAAR
jgi:squalene synthase HpnC